MYPELSEQRRYPLATQIVLDLGYHSDMPYYPLLPPDSPNYRVCAPNPGALQSTRMPSAGDTTPPTSRVQHIPEEIVPECVEGSFERITHEQGQRSALHLASQLFESVDRLDASTRRFRIKREIDPGFPRGDYRAVHLRVKAGKLALLPQTRRRYRDEEGTLRTLLGNLADATGFERYSASMRWASQERKERTNWFLSQGLEPEPLPHPGGWTVPEIKALLTHFRDRTVEHMRAFQFEIPETF